MADLQLIAEPRREAAQAALQAAFGAASPGPFALIEGGVSGAQILRFNLRDRDYVLRIEPERVAFADRDRGFSCMSAAAHAGVAPAVHHADASTGVTIMDHIAGQPLLRHPGGAPGLARGLGGLIAKLQAARPFPRVAAYPTLISGLLVRLAGSLLAPKTELAACAEGLARITAVLTWDDAVLAPSHNDPNPRNLLFDGDRLWLVDWELAAANDPLIDAAILTTELAAGPELELALLEALLGSPPGESVRARLRIVRLLTRLFYGVVVLESLGGAFRPSPDIAATRLTPAGFRAAVVEGRLASGAPATAYAFARMSLRAFLDGLSAPGFDDALKAAGQG